MISAARKNSKILGIFLFGTERVAEFIRKGFTFVSIGNDLHCILTQAQVHMKTLREIFPVEIDPSNQQSTQPAPSKVSADSSSSANLAKGSKGRGSGPESDESTNLVLAACAAAVIVVLGFTVWRSRKV